MSTGKVVRVELLRAATDILAHKRKMFDVLLQAQRRFAKAKVVEGCKVVEQVC